MLVTFYAPFESGRVHKVLPGNPEASDSLQDHILTQSGTSGHMESVCECEGWSWQ